MCYPISGVLFKYGTFSLWCNIHTRLIGKIMGTLYSGNVSSRYVPGTLAANLVDLA